MTTRTMILGAVLAGVVAAGCSSGGDSGDGAAEPTTVPADSGTATDGAVSDGDEPGQVDYAVAFEEPGADDLNRLLEPADELLAERQIEILDVAIADEATVVLAFELGSHHCNGVRTEIEESDTEVVVTLIGGQLAEVNPAACAYGTYPYTAEVVLDEPVGDRTIIPAEPTEPDEVTPTPWRPAPTADGTDEPDEAAEDADLNVDFLLGEFIEDGVEWALANDIEWRLLIVDGEPVGARALENPDRLSFVVDADRIVAYEWS